MSLGKKGKDTIRKVELDVGALPFYKIKFIITGRAAKVSKGIC